MMILMVIILVIAIASLFMEKNVFGYYKVTNTFGRVYAYFAMAGAVGGVVGIVTGIAGLNNGGATNLLAGVICLALGVFLYFRVYKKSPVCLKKRCLIDLTIVGFATAMRVSLFFMMFFFKTWWTFNKPEICTTDDGQEVYVMPDGYVYSSSLGKSGKLVTKENGQRAVLWEN